MDVTRHLTGDVVVCLSVHVALISVGWFVRQSLAGWLVVATNRLIDLFGSSSIFLSWWKERAVCVCVCVWFA